MIVVFPDHTHLLLETLYTTIVDANKAFDVVLHGTILVKLWCTMLGYKDANGLSSMNEMKD